MDVNGIIHKSEASKGDVAASYFQKLFSSSDPSNPLDLLEGFESRVTDEMNELLVAKVSKEEVKFAVFSIKPSSAPGADGMTGLFFQQYWDFIGDQVFKEVAGFFDDGVFPREWNFTQLCLIPKRLKPLLPGIISPNQSAFVPERLISDNILIAHEAVYALRTHPTISRDFLAVKTDMSKAYDRMEWSYLKAILLFLFKAFKDQSKTIQDILSAYGKVTGQLINLEKSSISFGQNVDLMAKENIQQKLGIFSEGGSGSYLGLPECFSGSKVDLLAYIHEKMKARMSGWFARTLSRGGKEVLLKAVAMSMPVYAMSCFKLPKTTCDNLSAAMAAFWWDTTEDKRKMHWIGWDKLYFDDSSFLNASLGARPSFAWRSILHGRYLLKQGLKRMIGDGENSLVWTDQWVLDGTIRAPLMKNIIFDLNLRVRDLLDPQTGSWDMDRLQFHFYPRDVELILKIKPVTSSEDFFIWEHTKSGEYSVKSGYWFAFQREKVELISVMLMQPSIQPIKDLIWKCLTPTKIKNFLWKVVSGAIPVVDKMLGRGLKVDSRCQSCGGEGESANHVNLGSVKAKWMPPPHDWLKCNIGSSWDRLGSNGGAAWVLRDEHGLVLTHGRRSFASVTSKLDASILCWQWAIESMKSLRIDKIIFASEDTDLIGAVLRPPAWPSYKFQSLLLLHELGNFLDWKLFGEVRATNLGAHLIAKSVTVEDRRQSINRRVHMSYDSYNITLKIKFIRCNIGNGEDTWFWHDYWTPLGPLLSCMGDQGPRCLRIPLNAKVNSACNENGWLLAQPRSDDALTLHIFLSTIRLPSLSLLVHGLVYSVWKQRNNLHHNHIVIPPLAIFKDINRMVINSITARRKLKNFRKLMPLWLH
ncbi:Reverse transcriptase zinc-binding domain [Arabidopsis thaliana x Arabidopsis arenosa]|uniref:Reverse transcriptase zinc-binding domain n=1 Tax=Arabidopsis thaliana x Arabidopsis arenosa TaxID=1240361 RepID=A0A8T1Z2Q0_9BRAS|nr:Reverse transcriptase zinc-binding domain [Arabidopsis thaliana x Arabidopsis arenosa]